MVGGGTMACAEHEPITGVWEQSPQRGPGAEPLVRGSGGAKPPEAESILVIGCPTEPANLAPFQKCICISTLGATVMIWEKFMSKSRGSGDPPCPFLGRPWPDGRLPLLSARSAVTPATLKRAATNFAAWWTEARWVWTVCLRQRRGWDLNPGPSAPVPHASHSATEPPDGFRHDCIKHI